MDHRSVLRIQGVLLLSLALFMLVPLLLSVAFRDGQTVPFAVSALVTGLVGALLFFGFRERGDLGIREGFAIVTFAWVSAAVFGALPFVVSGAIPSVTDAFFESMSGFTTTGATILADIESIPRSVLFWRSLTQWLGGMGIVVLALVILPYLGVGGMQLFKAEVPGPTPDKLKPRITETAKTLWGTYVLISGLETMLLMMGGLDWFDAVVHTFTTMATGGFSPYNDSIGHFTSPFVHYVIVVFMFVAGVNFSLHYWALRRQFWRYGRDSEFRFYVWLFLGVTLVVMLDGLGRGVFDSFEGALRNSAFQVVSIATTTGFVTHDYETWGPLSYFLIFLLFFVGGCAGSTGGSIKTMRVILLLKHGWNEVNRLLHPRGVYLLKMRGKPVPEGVIPNVLGFFLLYMVVIALFGGLLSWLGVDFSTSIGAVASCLGNIGPGLGDVGPTEHYGYLPGAGKWLLSTCMLLGRLELFTVLVLLLPGFWKRV
jgi:trk system potassium uptake protein TrkH